MRYCLPLSCFGLLALVLSALLAAADPNSEADTSKSARGKAKEKASQEAADGELSPEAAAAAESLRATLPPDSEAMQMLTDILRGSRLEPDSGWFAVAKSQTRFTWQSVADQWDADGDGNVSAAEFGGSGDDYQRIDRDADGRLTQADFAWDEPSTKRTPGAMLFYAADKDGNGKVTPEEFAHLLAQLDHDQKGFLALDDVANAFAPLPPPSPQTRPDWPSRSTLVLALQRQELGSLQPGPNVGDVAPDFSLTSLTGRDVTLSQEVGEKPVVLIFGNFTCGPFRSQSGNIERLYERYRDRAKFFLVYVREAHPRDGWWMVNNQSVGIDITQPQVDSERREVAATCQKHLGLDLPFLVDSTDDRVGSNYSGMPNRLYLIDRKGHITFKSGRGPFGFRPRELEQALLLLLAHDSAQQRAPQ